MIRPGNIKVIKNGCIAVITITKPPQNYLGSPEFISKDTLRQIAEDENTKGIIITGAGRHFSAGADLDNLFKMAGNEAELKNQMTAGSALLETISSLKIPVIAAINGVCWGGGLEVAMACHIRIASAKALFAFPEVNINLVPGLGGIGRLVSQSGTFASLSMLLSGDTIDAEKALTFQIINEITQENVLDYAFQYLNKLVESKPKKVITSIMQAIHNAYRLPLLDALHEETRMFCELAMDESAKRKSGS